MSDTATISPGQLLQAPTASPPVTGLAVMHPAYFAMVMATGIVSIASHLLGYRFIAASLLSANVAFYIVLWVLTILRVTRHRDRVVADLMHHGRSVGFFTIVAGTCVLGSQFWIVVHVPPIAIALWIAGIVFWAVLTYGIITALTVKAAKPGLAEGINGGWLLPVVAAQSVCVLGAQIASTFGPNAPKVLLFCLAVWLGGGMLYIWIISLIFYRYTFFTLSPTDLAPPYWINMGAVAISTLAGCMLIVAAPQSPVLMEILPFLKGFTLFFWSTATWWIPMLFILGIWRHVYKRFPLRYDPLYWGAVFPLGMYTACTIRLSTAIADAAFLMVIPLVFIFVALAAWLATFVGLIYSLLISPRRAPRERV